MSAGIFATLIHTSLPSIAVRRLQTMVKARALLVMKHFEGEPKESDFKLVEEELPALKDGEILAEALYLSVDPYMRVYVRNYGHPLGTTMLGGQVARVTETKHPDYKIGDIVYGSFGWRTHTNVNIKQATEQGSFLPAYKLPDLKGLSPSLGVGALGMPGNTAYFGFLEICQPKEGETVVVSGAAGAVGSLVGQIAKVKGCRVIGIAGSADKCKMLETELGFDKAINYKTDDVAKVLREAAPKGVDCYFDNVGGNLSAVVINQMNLFGRISVCGAISSYNADVDALPQAPIIQPAMVWKQLKMEGFVVPRWADRWMEGIKNMAHWIAQGKIKTKETVTEGFENMPKAFIGMLRGENTGKAVVKA